MKHSKLLSLVLALMLALSLAAVPALAAEAEDGDAALTRGEFVTALYRLSDDWVEAPQEDYDDVPAEGEVAVAVRWATENGIVNGYGRRRFGPDDPVTREQMAAMLYRWAQKQGQGFQGLWYFPLDFPDAAQVSDWADEAMHWVVMHDIIIGTDKGLEPKATATDDQLSLVLQRWQKSLGDTADGVWYCFGETALAMKVPADTEFTLGGGNDLYTGRSERLFIVLSRWDQIGGPTVGDLAALAEDSTMEPAEVVAQGELQLVKSNRADREVCYFLNAPDGDSWSLWILPNTDADPTLTADGVAEEEAAVAASLRHYMTVPEGETAVRMLVAAHPDTDYLVLVNKTNALPEGWEDALELVWTVNSVGDTVEVERAAYKQFLALKADLAENDGVYVELDSAYRSVAAQQDIMDRFTEKYGAAYAARTVAQPGYSEHHTGLALDLYFRIKNDDGSFTDVYYNEDMELAEYSAIWDTIHAKLAQHEFILRYVEGKEHVTGYRAELWHIRYVASEEVADAIMSRPGMTLEEYLAGESAPEAAVDLGDSAVYTDAELRDAVLAIKCQFAAWAGCELHAVRYAGDEANSEENVAWLNTIHEGAGYTQVAEFLTDFHSPVDPGLSAWGPDTEYTDYQWWLARTEGGDWTVVSTGY